jgi:diguanylate cyclase (GGDEF)-like protein/PAS domain S-box-containing protein
MKKSKLKNDNQRFKFIFENSPIAIWEEDASCFVSLLNQLKKKQIVNYRKYLVDHPLIASRAFRNIKVIDVNKAALDLYGAKSKIELYRRFAKTLTKSDLKVFVEEFMALTSGEKIFEKEFSTRGSDGKRYDLWLRIAVPNNFELTLKSIIVTLEDITKRKKKENVLRRAAMEDSLTGLLNHKAISQRLGEELSRSKRFNAPMSCLMIDIDYFKPINDNFGHQIGDKMLVQVAMFLKKLIRSTDLIGRYGGDEFLVILSATEQSGALTLAERIRQKIANKKFKLTSKVTISNTLSIGITAYPINQAKTTTDIIHLADKALYQAKGDGRNCVRSVLEP